LADPTNEFPDFRLLAYFRKDGNGLFELIQCRFISSINSQLICQIVAQGGVGKCS
jgi:hypothetical protein